MLSNEKSSFKEAEEWDLNYAKLYNIPVINQNAIRVEQGEYVVTDLKQEIGTFNVLQCVVLYVRNPKTGLHGIAHIDGHTEIDSLKEFFAKFNPEKGDLEVKIFGANSGTSMGVNDSKQNLEKVKAILESDSVQDCLKNKDIDALIKDKDTKNKDFVIDGEGKVKIELAAGRATECRALHSIQETRRRDGYIGSYPIIEAYDYKNESIYLDELAIFKLKEYEKDLGKDKKNRDYRDTSDYREFDAAIPKILSAWEASVKEISKAAKTSKLLLKNEEEVITLLKSTPLYIGNDSLKKNIEIIDILEKAENINDLETQLKKFSKNNASISQAIKIAAKYDEKLDEKGFLESLTKNYNEKNKVALPTDQILNKRYGGEISVGDFTGLLKKHSPKLSALMVLNSQGGYPSKGGIGYTIAEALDAANTIDPNLAKQMQQIIDKYNHEPVNIEFQKDHLLQAFDLGLANAKVPCRANIERIRLSSAVINNFSDFERYINESQSIKDEFKKNLISETKKEFENIQLNITKAQLIEKESLYRRIQDEFLTAVQGKLPTFNDITISTELANPYIGTQKESHRPTSKSSSDPHAYENAFNQYSNMHYEYQGSDINAIGAKIIGRLKDPDIMFVNSLGRGNAQLNAEAILTPMLKDFKEGQKLVGAYNTGGNHWVAFSIIKIGDDYRVYYKDSLGAERADLEKDIGKALNGKVTFHKFEGREQNEAPLVSCGLFALKNLHKFATTENAQLSKIDAFYNPGKTEKSAHDPKQYEENIKALREEFAVIYAKVTYDQMQPMLLDRMERQAKGEIHKNEKQHLEQQIKEAKSADVDIATLPDSKGYIYRITCEIKDISFVQPYLEKLTGGNFEAGLIKDGKEILFRVPSNNVIKEVDVKLNDLILANAKKEIEKQKIDPELLEKEFIQALNITKAIGKSESIIGKVKDGTDIDISGKFSDIKPITNPIVSPRSKSLVSNLDRDIYAAQNAFSSYKDPMYQYQSPDIYTIASQLKLTEDAVFVGALGRGHGEINAQSQLKQFERALEEGRKIVGVYNTGGNHWIAFAITKSKNGEITVAYNDSLGHVRKDLEGELEKVLGKEIKYHKHLEKTQTEEVAVSCGLFALKNMEALARADDLSKVEGFYNPIDKGAKYDESIRQLRGEFGLLYAKGIYQQVEMDLERRALRSSTTEQHSTEAKQLAEIINKNPGCKVTCEVRTEAENPKTYGYHITFNAKDYAKIEEALGKIIKDKSQIETEPLKNGEVKLKVMPNNINDEGLRQLIEENNKKDTKPEKPSSETIRKEFIQALNAGDKIEPKMKEGVLKSTGVDIEDKKGMSTVEKVVVGALALAGIALIVATFWKKRSLRRNEKATLEAETGIKDYNFKDELLKANDGKQQEIIKNLQSLQEETVLSPSKAGQGRVVLIAEDDHSKDHSKNVSRLIDEIKLRTREENSREVIFLERKEEGNNLGMKDVKLLAEIIKYNETSKDQIIIPKEIKDSPIYHDALLYNVAKENGAMVIGAEGKGLKHSKESPEYDRERENYMVTKMNELLKAGYNVTMPVGREHTKNLEQDLGDKSYHIVKKENNREQKILGRFTEHVVLSKSEVPQKRFV